MEKRITVTWRGDLDFEAGAAGGVTVPIGDAGTSATLRPTTLLLAALAGCTGMDAISIMRKKRQAVERYRIEASGTQRDEHPRIFTSIVLDHVIEGASIDDVAVARAIELSARRYCAVGAGLASGDTAIEHRFIIRDERGERTCDCLTIGPRGVGLARDEE
jgi:putative redox protein